MSRPLVNIPPTLLNQYMLFKTEAYNGTILAEDVVSTITKKFEPNEKMAIGGAFHEMIEHGLEPYSIGGGMYEASVNYWDKPIQFHPEHAEAVEAYRNAYPSVVDEVPGKVILKGIGGYDVQVRFKIDGIMGFVLRERKTTTSNYKPNYMTYFESMQWRLYLLALPDAYHVEYDVFQLKFPGKRSNARCTYYNFVYPRYEELENDVRRWLLGLINFCESQEIIEQLKMNVK